MKIFDGDNCPNCGSNDVEVIKDARFWEADMEEDRYCNACGASFSLIFEVQLDRAEVRVPRERPNFVGHDVDTSIVLLGLAVRKESE